MAKGKMMLNNNYLTHEETFYKTEQREGVPGDLIYVSDHSRYNAIGVHKVERIDQEYDQDFLRFEVEGEEGLYGRRVDPFITGAVKKEEPTYWVVHPITKVRFRRNNSVEE